MFLAFIIANRLPVLVTHARIFDDGQGIACAIRNKVDIFDVKSGTLKLTLSGPHVADVACVEIVYDDDLFNEDPAQDLPKAEKQVNRASVSFASYIG